MADFYNDMQSMATELLTDFNQGTMTYKSSTPATPFEPAVDTVVPFKGTATGVAFKYRNDLVTASDIEITAAVFKAPFWDDSKQWDDSQTWNDEGVYILHPQLNSTVTIDNIERQIIQVRKIPASGTPILFKIFVRG